MTRLGTAALAAVLALPASLLLARVHPFGDAGLYAATPEPARIMQHSNVPPRVRDLLIAKCADCHSTQTRAPLYGHLAPISWLMERDILEGRKHMNLSAWDTYSPDEQQTLQSKILQQTRTRKMPLPQYQNIHRGSAITPADLDLLTEWAHLSSQPDPAPNKTPTAGDPVQGRLVFEKRCTGCHSLDQNREGPRLRGVFGRTSGQFPNFPYSSALKDAHILWNEQTLDRWLTDPDTFVPQNGMSFRVTRPDERRDLIRFLKESAEK
jgi:cytochrome c